MEFQYRGRTLTYVIERKNMKNIRVRVKEDGIIHVSAPHRAPDDTILQFLLENAGTLAGLIDRALEQKAAASDYSDGARIRWLGEQVVLHWLDKPRPTQMEGSTLYIFARTQQEAKTAVRQWMIAECQTLYGRINREVYEVFRKKGYSVPLARIQVKEMTSRWGSCTASSGRISMNFRLLQYPMGCIYGVFFHEYAHFLHQDHSSHFYDVLLDVYPEYRKWDAILKAPLP